MAPTVRVSVMVIRSVWLVPTLAMLLPGPARGAGPAEYAQVVHAQLTRAAAGFVDQYKGALAAAVPRGAAGAYEIQIDASGACDRIGAGASAGSNAADDLARAFVLAAEPFAPPPQQLLEGGRATCVVRIDLARRRIESAAACFEPGRPVPSVVGLTQRAGEAADPAARIFAGWATEAAGNLPGAADLYQKSLEGASGWDLAARALGLALVRADRAEEAMPLIERYVTSRAPPADVADLSREVERFARYQKSRSGPRARLSKADIADGLKEGYDLLEPCLQRARGEYALAVGSDTLSLSFKIRNDGSVYGARLEGPDNLVMTTHAECVERVVERWRFAAFTSGDEVTITRMPVKVRGSDRPPPAPAKAVLASAGRDAPPARPEISRCTRPSEEITAHVRGAFGALSRCARQERDRNPRARLPDALPIAFVVASSGAVDRIEINHRHFRSGPFKTCVEQALRGRLQPSGGADCPTQFDLDLSGLNHP